MVQALSDEDYEKIKVDAGGDTVRVETVLGTAVFRSPTPEVFWQAVAMVAAHQGPESVLYLAQQCVVHPDRATFDQWADKRPGIPKSVEDAIDSLGGLDKEPTATDDGDKLTVQTARGPASFRCPNGKQFRDHQRMASKKGQQEAAFTMLALACVEEPTRDVMARWIREKPGISVTVCAALHKFAGLEDDAQAKR